MARARVAFIGTGGTISSLGAGPLDTTDYAATGRRLEAQALLERVPEAALAAEVFAVPYKAVPSTEIGFADWRALLAECHRLARAEPDLAGIVIGHGTATLEETAYFLSLTLKVALPVVLVGSQRPISALSTDAGMNLVNAVRVAACAEARGMGVLVLLNDEIHAARDVGKTSTLRLQTFRTPDFGALGHADGDRVAFYRHPLRRTAPDTEFDVESRTEWPRVDIGLSYAGGDGTAIRAFVAAGAQGLVQASLAPGLATPAEHAALCEAVAAGVVVVQSTRVGSGRVALSTKLRESGILSADNLTPQKARILLTLALTTTRDPDAVARIFATY